MILPMTISSATHAMQRVGNRLYEGSRTRPSGAPLNRINDSRFLPGTSGERRRSIRSAGTRGDEYGYRGSTGNPSGGGTEFDE